MEAHTTREDDEAVQQRLATRYVFQLQVWDTKSKLDDVKREEKSERFHAWRSDSF